MRSSNKRSRNKNNRNRPMGGNIINRVFDSSGPEGKVRGTPQQIIDKYNQLTRDAQLSGDRVNAENFAQHAEHYTRMLAEAQREIEQRREQQEQQNQQRQQNQSDNRQPGENRQGDQPQAQNDARVVEPVDPQPQDDATQSAADGDGDNQPRKPRNRRKPRHDVIDTRDDDSSGLVETPENAPKPRRTRKPKSTPAPEAADDTGSESQSAD